jgi:TonB-dependent starch-binding outer membrane protein SusC
MKKLYIIILLLLAGGAEAFSQNLIEGVIKDDKSGELLIGATVLVKGTNNGAATDVDGKFTLTTSQAFPFSLVVNYVGYNAKEIEVYELPEEPLQLSLKNRTLLDEVVVVGYGTQKKGDMTGAVSSISNIVIQQTPTSSFERVLQGTAPGVQVTQSSEQPGASMTVRIRGGNSLNGGNEPLYVIDGFPIYNDNSTINPGALSGASVNALATINPGDFESIEVLKDASATAIYGSRGANGVVLITTKRGKANETRLSYDAYYGGQQITKKLDLLNAQEWAQFKNDALANSGKTPLYTEEEIASLGKGTDWQSNSFRYSRTQNHQLTLAGGDDKTQYSISGGYLKQEGILLNTDFERLGSRVNIDRNFINNIKVGASLYGSRSKSNTADGNVVRYILTMAPTVPLKNEATGEYTLQSPYGSFGNPVATLKNVTNQSVVTRLLPNFYGEYKFLENFKARITLGADILSTKQSNYYPRNTYTGAQTQGSGAVGSQFTNTWLNENTLSYNKTFNGIHNFDVIVGYSYQASESEGSVSKAQAFPNDALGTKGLSSGTVSFLPVINKADWKLSSWLGRINYSLDGKYLLTLTARADGSSRFGANKRWGFFPSAALGWNASEEEFIQNIQQVSHLKLRVSAGGTGNQQIGQYQSLSQLDPYKYILGNNLVNGYAPSRVPNENLGWETTYQYDAGIDIGLFDNRINLTFDAYYKKTVDLLLDRPLPETSGFYTALQNLGKVENKGIELLVNTENFTGPLKWNTTITYARNQSKILDLGGLSYFYPEGGGERNIQKPTIVRVGEPVGNFYGYQTDGIFQTGDDIENTPRVDQKNTKPGDRKFVDQNGDGIINQDGDRVILGNAQPKFIGSITNTFSYKNFDLSILLQGVYGNKILNYNRVDLETPTGFQQVSRELLERWTTENPSNSVPRAVEVSALWLSDRYVEDGSFLRVKNVVLGYTLPESLSDKIKASKLRIYVSGQNLFTFTNYSGFDPEVSRNEQNNLYQGIDFGNYPNYKSYIVGLNLSF